jgi:hypothetical protein
MLIRWKKVTDYLLSGNLYKLRIFLCLITVCNRLFKPFTPEDYNELARWATGRSWENYGGGGWNLRVIPLPLRWMPELLLRPIMVILIRIIRLCMSMTGLLMSTGMQQQQYPDIPRAGSFGNYVQAGQGFYVLALYNNISFSFTPAMQVHQNDLVLMKSASAEDPWPDWY